MKNNRIILSSLFILFMLLLNVNLNKISAQENTIGIKGGLNLSSMSIENSDENNILPGFHAGIWGRYMLNEKFGLQPEVLYSGKGVKAVYDQEFLGFDVADGETKLNMNYIEIPFHITYFLSDDFNFHLGPYAGILLGAKMDTDAEILEFLNYDNTEEIDKEEFNNFDLGISGGLEFIVHPVSFGFNYSIGFSEIAKEESNMRNLLEDAKNNNIQLYISLIF